MQGGIFLVGSQNSNVDSTDLHSRDIVWIVRPLCVSVYFSLGARRGFMIAVRVGVVNMIVPPLPIVVADVLVALHIIIG
jgi:hypothetical protein